MVLHITPRYHPLPIGGAERQLSKLAPKLAASGIKSMILTWDGGRRRLPRCEIRDGIRVFRLTEWGIPWRGVRRLPSLWMSFNLLCFLLSQRKTVEFVHVHALTELAFFSMLWCRLLGIPCAAKATAVSAIKRGVRTRWGPIGRMFWFYMTRQGWIIAMSDHIAACLEESGMPRERILLIRNGVEVCENAHQVRGGRDSGIVVAATSTLSQKKRLDLLIKAARILHEKDTEIRWVIAGDGPERTRLESLAKKEGVDRLITWLGYREDVFPVLKDADIFVLTSEDEGISNSVLEAMAVRLPAVVRRAGFNDELVQDGETGLTFNGTPSGLAKCVLRLARDPELRKTLGDNAHAAVLTRNSFESVCEKYAAMLNQLGVEVPAANLQDENKT